MRINETTASREKLPLPTPDFNSAPTLMSTSVFSNPFVEAERAKSAILEKHVKMTPTLDDTKMINGRKICWNYRKGRCRFGHNCTFAHDSDLHRSAAELEALRTPQETLVCQTRYNGQQQQTSPVANDEENEVDQENNQTANRKRKKRPGLSQLLLPSKKVFKLYKAQQQQQTKTRWITLVQCSDKKWNSSGQFVTCSMWEGVNLKMWKKLQEREKDWENNILIPSYIIYIRESNFHYSSA